LIKLVGLGLSLDSMTLRTLIELAKCDVVYLDTYTSIWFPSLSVLEGILKKLGIEIRLARRSDLEGAGINELLRAALDRDVCIAVAGDPMVATTHSAILVDAVNRGIGVSITLSTSIMNAIASMTCLQVYRLGKIATVVKPKNGIFYEYPLRVLAENRERGLHTPLLLEIDVDNGYFMDPREAIEILLEAQRRLGMEVLRDDDIVIVLKNVGRDEEPVEVSRVADVLRRRYERGVYTLVVPAKKLHPVEEECLNAIAKKGAIKFSIGLSEHELKHYLDIVAKIVSAARSVFKS